MKSLNWGTIPPDLAIDEPYLLDLNASDEKTVCAIINQGIDSALEAVFADDGGIHRNKHRITIHDSASMRTFLRRCVESDDDNAHELASCIMTTLGYEWI